MDASLDSPVRYDQFPHEGSLTAQRLSKYGAVSEDSWTVVEENGWLAMRIRGGIVQVVRHSQNDDLFKSFLEIDPVELQDDAGWFIYSVKQGFHVYSNFGITYGPFTAQSLANDVLDVYGLELKNEVGYVRGEAFFPELSTPCFADALVRLRWLESYCVIVNREVESVCTKQWEQLVSGCENAENFDIHSEEILSPPNLFHSLPPKTRASFDLS